MPASNRRDFIWKVKEFNYVIVNIMINLQQEFGRKLKKARENRQLTQEDVARKAEMTGNYYAKIERGEINPTLETVYKLIKALKAKPNDIIPN